MTNFSTIFFALPSDLASLRSGIAFQVVAIFHSARFLVFGTGTSILPAVLFLVDPWGTMLLKMSWSGLSGLLALHASIAELEQSQQTMHGIDRFKSGFLEQVLDSDVI